MTTEGPPGNDHISLRGRIDEIEYTLNGEHIKRDLAEERRRQAEDGDNQEYRIVGLTFEEAWQVYLDSVNRPDSGPRTLSDYEQQFDRFKRWVAKQHPECLCLRDITEDVAEEYATWLLRKRRKGRKKTPCSTGTFNKCIRILQLIYRVLQKKAKISENPWTSIVRKREQMESRRELTVEELDTICNQATDQLRVLLVLGIYTGMRLGDCCTLRWSEVDMARRMILRVLNKTKRMKNRPVHIPMHPTLHAVLAEVTRRKNGRWVLPAMARKCQIGAAVVTREIQAHFASCGIQIHKDGTGPGTGKRAIVEVGFHSLRHSFVSLCRQANAPLAVVEAIVGHSNPAMTRHYTHVGQLAASRAVAALPALGHVTEQAHVASPVPERTLAAKTLLESFRRMRWILHRTSAESWDKDRNTILRMLDQLEEKAFGLVAEAESFETRLG